MVFPFPEYFDNIIKVEWAHPGGGNLVLFLVKRLYALPEEAMEDLKVPLVGAPLLALDSGAVLPEYGENALKRFHGQEK